MKWGAYCYKKCFSMLTDNRGNVMRIWQFVQNAFMVNCGLIDTIDQFPENYYIEFPYMSINS